MRTCFFRRASAGSAGGERFLEVYLARRRGRTPIGAYTCPKTGHWAFLSDFVDST